MQDMGARDPTIGEIESDFAEKNLWNWDTDHLTRCACIHLHKQL